MYNKWFKTKEIEYFGNELLDGIDQQVVITAMTNILIF